MINMLKNGWVLLPLAYFLVACSSRPQIYNYSPSEVYLQSTPAPQLQGNTNLDLYKYADECRIQLNMCNAKIEGIKNEVNRLRK